MRIFLDVGAHRGQTLRAVLGLAFDRVHCFEPVPDCWPDLDKLAGGHVRIERFGLWDRDADAVVYDPGTMGAGLWVKDKRRTDTAIASTVCHFRRASDWFRDYLAADDQVFLKLNCEGCECDVLNDLLDSGEFDKVGHVMVDFDARKITDLRDKLYATRIRLSAHCSAPRFLTSKEAMVGDTHARRVHHWLRMVGFI